MGNKLKILLFSPYLPSSDTVGCARKIYDFILLANQRGHSVYLLSFCSQEDKKRVAAISPYCTNIYLEYLKDYRRYPNKSFYFQKTIEEFSRNRTVDILQCENSYLRRYFPPGTKMPSVLVEHEILSGSFWERAGFEGNLIKKLILYARAVKKSFEEKNWYRQFNRIIVFSEVDKNIIFLRHKRKNIDVIALGINSKEYALSQESEKLYDLIFVGNFSHFPNVDAVLYFCKEILPLIKKILPNVSFLIAGANPPLLIKNLPKFDKNIMVTGYIENLKDSYAKSKIFVAPIRYGTGMRFKILEALASGMAVVATSIGARGINSKDIIKIADGKWEFAAAVMELFGASDKRRELAIRGRTSVEKYYDWSKLLDKYENIYHNLLHLRPN
ncbi:MAG: glycosyltransferase family 4 protein [Candidatus Omnitrophica bacterium]|nr:glycosyltransferase family 4 protein [Candidatus Omnitrophota bacterium]